MLLSFNAKVTPKAKPPPAESPHIKDLFAFCLPSGPFSNIQLNAFFESSIAAGNLFSGAKP